MKTNVLKHRLKLRTLYYEYIKNKRVIDHQEILVDHSSSEIFSRTRVFFLRKSNTSFNETMNSEVVTEATLDS